MENSIRIQLNIAASQVIQQFILRNEDLEKVISKAIEKAINDFQFEKEVHAIVSHHLRNAISESMEYGKLKEVVKKRTEAIFNTLLDKELSKYESK